MKALFGRPQTWIALALIAAGALLGLRHVPGGPTLALAIASLTALGTTLGLGLAALTAVAGLATPPAWQPTLLMSAGGVALAGLGLGLALRALERLRVGLSSLAAGALLALIAVAALALPEGGVRLASADGAPLTVPALLVDGASFMRVAVDVPVEVPLANPGGSFPAIALTASLIAALALLVAHLQGRSATAELKRGAWLLAALAAGLAASAALLGLGQLLFGSFGSRALELDAEALRRALDLAGSRDGAVIDVIAPAAAELRYWSRPWIDGLRLVPALALLWLALRGLRARAEPEPQPDRTAFSLAPFACAATALGAGLYGAVHGLHGATMALLAGLVLAVGALASERLSDVRGAIAPALGLFAGALLWIYAWLVPPLFGA